jgi:glycine betaine/proline transport system ATP-binding protein
MDEKRLRELRRSTMSMVFQRFGLFSHRRVIDNIAYGLEVQGMSKDKRMAKAREILELVELHGWENHYPHELSGGMQQRVGLARALAVDPEVLLCDEPFSALDPLIRRDMQNELLRLQRNLRKTMVFITHDFLEAIKLGDRIAIMKDGEIVQIGTPEQIVAHPINDYVREFTKDVPRVKVLTARSVMKPVHTKEELIGKAIAIDTTLEALIPLTVDSDEGVPIIDSDNNLVGIVDRKSVMLALAEEATGATPAAGR